MKSYFFLVYTKKFVGQYQWFEKIAKRLIYDFNMFMFEKERKLLFLNNC